MANDEQQYEATLMPGGVSIPVDREFAEGEQVVFEIPARCQRVINDPHQGKRCHIFHGEELRLAKPPTRSTKKKTRLETGR